MQDNAAKDNSYKNDKTRFIISLSISLFFVLIMLIEIILDQTLNLNLYKYGILPRTVIGLRGIIFSPFIHGSFEHFFSNSAPFLILLTGLLYFFPKKGFLILSIIIVVSDFMVWIIGRESYHIGASGIIYGLASFIFFSGVLSRRKEYIALSLIVIFLYGSLIWGIFPGADQSISWEAHLSGFSIGTIISLFYHPRVNTFTNQKNKNINFSFKYNFIEPSCSSNQKINYFYTKIESQNNNYYIDYEKDYFSSTIYFSNIIFTGTETIF